MKELVKMSFHKKNNVKIFARLRPAKNGDAPNNVHVITTGNNRDLWVKSEYQEKKFNFDHVFKEDSSQADVYKTVLSPLLANTLAGYNSTVFAYGHTGTGKTHTIFGPTRPSSPIDFQSAGESEFGLVPQITTHIFTELIKLDLKTEYTVRFSCVEIYNEEIRDLLNESKPLRIYDDPLNKGAICIKDIRCITVCNPREVAGWLQILINQRETSTNVNAQSSRSHILCTFVVNLRSTNCKGEGIITTGKLQLVDLAGAENAQSSRNNDINIRETATINRSLMTLTKVIKALSQKTPHVPFRDSKLTRVLQESLGGNARTSMIVCCAPTSNSFEDIVSTLELAQMVRTIVNSPHVNIEKKQASIVEELHSEVDNLRDELKAARGNIGFYISAQAYQRMTGEKEENGKKLEELLFQIRGVEQHSRSLGLQQCQIRISFDQTHAHVETVQKKLDETKKVKAAKMSAIDKVSGERKAMNKVVKELLKICDTSTANEDVYHKKFQEKAAASTSNSRISQYISAKTENAWRELYEDSRTVIENNNDLLNDAREAIAFLSTMDLQKIGNIADNLGACAALLKLEVQKVLGNHANSIVDFVDDKYHTRHEYIVQQHLLAEQLNHRVQNIIDAWNKEREVHDNFQKRMKEHMVERKLQVSDAMDFLSKVRSGTKERGTQITMEIDEEQKNNSFIRKQLANTNREENSLQERDKNVKKDMKHVRKLLEENNQHDKMGEHIEKYTEDGIHMYLQAIHSSKGEFEKLLAAAEVTKKKLCDQVIDDRRAITQYIEDLRTTVDRNLKNMDKVVQDSISNVISCACDVRQSVFATLMAKVAAINQVFDTLAQEQEDLHERTVKCVDVVCADLQTLDGSINFKGHIGDTPIKGKFMLPKRQT